MDSGATQNFFTIKIAKYLAVFKVNYSDMLAYMVNLLSGGLIILIRVWTFAQLYAVSYAATGVKEINGLSVALVVWSLTLAQAFQTAVRRYPATIIQEEVQEGTLAYAINKPYSYLLFHYFGFLGRTLPSLGLNLTLGAIAALLLAGRIPIGWQNIGAGAILLLLGYTLDFLFSAAIGLSAFWIEDTTPIGWMYQKGQLIFGGLIIPVALFPNAVQRVAELVPFSQAYYSPARIIVQFTPELFLRFLALQCIWIGIAFILAITLFKKGVRNVTINGG